MKSDGATADDQAVTAAQTNVNTASATLSADQAKQAQACAGRGASTPACSQDTQKVSQDQPPVEPGRPAAGLGPAQRGP